MNKKGSLVNVGLGMTLGSHITPLSRSYIENADVVFVGASHNLVEQWVQTMNDNVHSLQPYYQEGIPRSETYKKWVSLIMDKVRAGQQVCGAFYGHPGVFAWAPHESIKQARKEGYMAHMEPGISAEDCLYADIGIDPGTHGCAHFEATQFLIKNKIFDTGSYLVLWQFSLSGDTSVTKFSSSKEEKQTVIDILLRTYEADHVVIVYECAILPVDETRIDYIKLRDLATVKMTGKTTVVIPPIL